MMRKNEYWRQDCSIYTLYNINITLRLRTLFFIKLRIREAGKSIINSKHERFVISYYLKGYQMPYAEREITAKILCTVKSTANVLFCIIRRRTRVATDEAPRSLRRKHTCSLK